MRKKIIAAMLVIQNVMRDLTSYEDLPRHR
jgi:hypothetical protein